jgi:hypothetical protein
VFLERDRVGVVCGDAVHNLDVFDVKLVAAGRALIGADLALHNYARLLRKALESLEDFGGHAFYVGDALNGARSVAEDGKQQLAALTQVVKPAAQRDGLAIECADSVDRGQGRVGCYGRCICRRCCGQADFI